jgi:hypothetical protein
MSVDLKRCPSSPSHQVVGGYPDFVCTECATEWSIVGPPNKREVLYRMYRSNGQVYRRWRVPLGRKQAQVRKKFPKRKNKEVKSLSWGDEQC